MYHDHREPAKNSGSYFIFDEPSRKLETDEQKNAWEAAVLLGAARLINMAGDNAFDKFTEGITTARKYMKKNALRESAVDYPAFLEASAKTAMSVAPQSWHSAYTDMHKALGKDNKAEYDAQPLEDYIKAFDDMDSARGLYTTDKYALCECGEYAKRLQEALNFAGYTDRYGNALKEDGVFGPRTYYACMQLNSHALELCP